MAASLRADAGGSPPPVAMTEQDWNACRDPVALRRAFACYPSGVAAICGLLDGEPAGLAVSTFTPVSLDPPLVSACVAHTSTTWPRLKALPRLGISVLAAEHADVAADLASRRADRFARIDWSASARGAVFVNGAALWIHAELMQYVTAGDHDIVIFAVHGLRGDASVPPMVFHRSRYQCLPTTD